MSERIYNLSEKMDEIERAARLKGGGGGGTFDPMEQRVARLETDIKEVLSELKGFRSDLTAIRVDLGELKGKVSNLPTINQIVSLVVAVMAGIFAIVKFGLS